MTGPALARPWFRIEPRNAAEEAEQTSADVFIYDEIGESFWGGGVSAQTMATELAALDVDQLHVYVNSPGGAAWDGIAIMNAIRRHRAHVTVHVDGLAASAASVIAMAGDHIVMNRGSQMLIHDASAGIYGNASTHEETAVLLQKLSDSIADVYAGRTSTERATWRAAMRAETWYTAEEAVSAGLADEWVDAPTTNPVDRSRFSAHARAAVPSLASLDLPISTETRAINRKELPVSDNLQTGIRELLGVTDADATDEQLLAAAAARLTEQASNSNPVVPEGTIVVDAAAFEQLQSDAAAGRAARDQQDNDRRAGIVSAAINDGRIAPSARDSWVALLATNEAGTVTVLDSLPKNTIIPVAEIGHSDTTKVLTADDQLMAAAGWATDDTKGA